MVELVDRARIYKEKLSRLPDEDGLNHFYNEIKEGIIKIDDLSTIIEQSHEFKSLEKLRRGFAITNDGYGLYLDPNDVYVSKAIAFSGTYEETETRFFKKKIKDKMNVIDIGANLGYFTILFSKLVGPQGKVFAFEPNPKYFEMLEKNKKENHGYNIITINKAVADFNGKSKFYLSKINFGDNRLPGDLIKDTDHNRDIIDVDVIKLDDFTNDKIDFLKIDAQGAEMKIINGATQTILDNSKLEMIVEFWPSGLLAQGTKPEYFLKRIEDLGFNIYDLSNLKSKKQEPEVLCSRISEKSFTNLYLTKLEIMNKF